MSWRRKAPQRSLPNAISHDDINLIMGAVFVVLANITVDLAQAWLDPRIRLGT